MRALRPPAQAERKKAAVQKLRAAEKGRAQAQKEGVLALLPLDEEPEKELAPVLENSLAWGAFMGLSANVRYQLINGFEERMLVRAPALSPDTLGSKT
jgi:hypothetical protein